MLDGGGVQKNLDWYSSIEWIWTNTPKKILDPRLKLMTLVFLLDNYHYIV